MLTVSALRRSLLAETQHHTQIKFQPRIQHLKLEIVFISETEIHFLVSKHKQGVSEICAQISGYCPVLDSS